MGDKQKILILAVIAAIVVCKNWEWFFYALKPFGKLIPFISIFAASLLISISFVWSIWPEFIMQFLI